MANDLIKEKERAPYQSTLRERHKEQTSQLILDSVGTIIRRADLAAVSIAEVARVADITERTIYRHYATRDDLIRAFIKWHLDQSLGGPHIKVAQNLDELLEWFGRRCRSWERDHQIITETYLSPLGRELRKPLYEFSLANNVKLLSQEIPGLPDETLRNLAGAILTLMSTENFVFLRQNLGYSADQVYRSAITTFQYMIEGAKRAVAKSQSD